MRVLLIAPYFDKGTPGESWSTFKWVEGICERFETTVLTTHKKDWVAANSPVRAQEIVNWPDYKLPKPLRRVEFELKPGYLLFYFRVRRWLREQRRLGHTFDLIHQINPLALRYPCPAHDFGVPYIMGPLAGSLPTPPGFREECKDRQWYRKLRQWDRYRLSLDPWMRRTYEGAAVVIGVAPYVREILGNLKIRRFEIMSETGVEQISDTIKQPPAVGEPLKLLFVGRVIRTKGVIDAIRAVAIAAKDVHLEFNIVGDGDSMQACRDEANRLNVSHLVQFHGRRSRQEVAEWYQKSHLFLFPSFREPSGNVVFEAMGQGLPIIAADYGGPGYSVTEEVGVRIEPSSPSAYAKMLGVAIIHAASHRPWIAYCSSGSLARIRKLAYWPEKIGALAKIYQGLYG